MQTANDLFLPVLLLASGIYATSAIGSFHLEHPIKTLKTALKPTKGDGNSPVKAMCLALAGTIGVGNIAGVALAIQLGGPGAVFWMWISALLVMAVKYAEILLAVKFKEKSSNTGGAMYYIRNGIGGAFGRILAFLFAILCILDSLAIGGAVQVSAAAEALQSEIGISPIITGTAVASICAIVVFGKRKSISDLTIKLVPAMSALYIGMSLFAIISKVDKVPSVFQSIFKNAFSIDSGVGGISGFFIGSGIKSGVSCGLLSNEAGCGTAPIAHASTNSKSAAQQGIWGMIEVFLDTIVICTMTAVVILVSEIDLSSAHGAALTAAAYSLCLGDSAGALIAICVLLFGFATIICWSYYGTVALSYLTKRKDAKLTYLVVFCLLLFVGAIILPDKVWKITDTIITVMSAINLFCVTVLMPQVKETTLAELHFCKKKNRKARAVPTASTAMRSKNQI